jgi:hypothetical protein
MRQGAPQVGASRVGPVKSDDRHLPVEQVGHEDVRAALRRVIASPPVRNAPRLAAFLCYVVERTLAGHGGRIKGYTIGVEALGRRPDFDPQSNPIVRVEAGRLRAALARYYNDAGRHDGVVIEIERGGYVPQFRYRDGRADRSLQPRTERKPAWPSKPTAATKPQPAHRLELMVLRKRMVELREQIVTAQRLIFESHHALHLSRTQRQR